MKYLNTREIYLNTLNEASGGTFENDITFGGSLLGRLINSIVRKAKIGINYTQIGSIADRIRVELDGLIEDSLTENVGAEKDKIVSEILLKEIYKVVSSNDDEKTKLEQLLDRDNEKGLISVTIESIKKLADDVNLGKGSKKDLIEKLEKFKAELEKIKIGNNTNNKISSGNNENSIVENTVNILKSIIGIHNIINKAPVEANVPKQIGTSIEKNAKEIGTSIEKNAKEIGTNKSDNKELNTNISNSKEINTNNSNSKEITTSERFYFSFKEFKINELLINGPKEDIKKDEHEILDIDHEEIKELKVKTGWKKIVIAYNGSVKEHMNEIIQLYNNYIQKNESDSIEKIGEKIILDKEKINQTTISYEKLLENVNIDGISVAIKQFSAVILGYKENIKEIDLIKEGGKYIKIFIISISDLFKTELNAQIQNTTNRSLIKKFDSFIYEDIQQSDVDLEEENSSDNIKNIWLNNFKQGEENEWKTETDIKKLEGEVENTKVNIDVKNDNTKDRIITIANLFDKAYRLYVKKLIPSGRPGGRISDKTFNEYIYLGKGETPANHTDKGPGPGPWANRFIFDKFRDKITELLEYKKYRAIFNAASIRKTNGEPMSGNVLLEFIRNMIDETEIKSFDTNRSKLLNKYFGLSVKKSVRGVDYGENDEDEDEDEYVKVKWKATPDPSINSGDIKVGSFIALYGESKIDKIEYSIIGHVLKVDDGYLLIKYQKNNERIPENFGRKINSTNQWYPNAGKEDDVYFGLIKLPIQEGEYFTLNRVLYKKVKNTNNEYTKDWSPDEKQYTKIQFKPSIKEMGKGESSRFKPYSPIAFLTYDENGKTNKVISTDFHKNVFNSIHKDIPVDGKGVGGIDNIFEILKTRFV